MVRNALVAATIRGLCALQEAHIRERTRSLLRPQPSRASFEGADG